MADARKQPGLSGTASAPIRSVSGEHLPSDTVRSSTGRKLGLIIRCQISESSRPRHARSSSVSCQSGAILTTLAGAPPHTDRSGTGAVPFTTGQQETIRRGHGPGQSRPRVDHAEMLARWGVCAPSPQFINSLCKWNDCAKLGRRYCLHNQIADDSSQDSGVCALVVDGSAAISRPLSNDRRRRQMGG